MKKHFFSIIMIISAANMVVPMYGMNEEFNNCIHVALMLDEKPQKFGSTELDKLDIIRMVNLGMMVPLHVRQDVFPVRVAGYACGDDIGNWSKSSCYHNSIPKIVKNCVLSQPHLATINPLEENRELNKHSFPTVLQKSHVDDLTKGKMIFFETNKEWVIALSIEDKQIDASSWIVYDKDGNRNERSFSTQFLQNVSKLNLALKEAAALKKIEEESIARIRSKFTQSPNKSNTLGSLSQEQSESFLTLKE